MAARIAGCDPIIAVDRLPSRLALARELGATHALESRGAETLAEIRKITGGGTDFALETSAVPAVFRLAVDGLRGLGICILVGSARAGTEVSFEMPWLQGGRIVRGGTSSLASSIFSWRAGCRSIGSSRATILPRSTALPPTLPRALR
jgi:aryl-alcohol dehydrogenase